MTCENYSRNRLSPGLLAMLLVFAALQISGCLSSAASTPTPSATSTGTQGTSPVSATPVPTNTPVTAQSTPAGSPETAPPTATETPVASETPTDAATSTETETATPTSSAAPEANDPYAMETLLTRQYIGGDITRESVLQTNAAYTSYLISYLSDGLRIYGVMRIPAGTGPFPAIVMNHGHYEPSVYQSGQGTDSLADILARSGYLTLASDYRGHGKSEGSPASFGSRTEYAVDVLNLIASIPSLPEANASRVGVWGHSMGGEVSMVAAEVSKDLKASVIWAPTSGDATVNAQFYSRRRGAPPETLDGARSAAMSPLYFVEHVSVPVSLHQGDIDQDVDPQWAIRWRDRLQVAGKQVEFYWYPGQGHNFRELGWGVIAPRTVEFYDRFLK